jgi:hypothetical protein
MIPTHILTDLTPDNCVAILSRNGELHFRVHPGTTDPEILRADALREGSEVIATHLQDPIAIRALVASRERDVGGES